MRTEGHFDKSVIVSALKKVDVSTYDAIKTVHDGWPFKGGITTYGPEQ